jgi:hypothetical protein
MGLGLLGAAAGSLEPFGWVDFMCFKDLLLLLHSEINSSRHGKFNCSLPLSLLTIVQ